MPQFNFSTEKLFAIVNSVDITFFEGTDCRSWRLCGWLYTQKTICVPDSTVTGIHINYYYCLFSSVCYFLFKRQFY